MLWSYPLCLYPVEITRACKVRADLALTDYAQSEEVKEDL